MKSKVYILHADQKFGYMRGSGETGALQEYVFGCCYLCLLASQLQGMEWSRAWKAMVLGGRTVTMLGEKIF